MNKAKITEIFSSIQGEGRYVGEKQLFIRFSGCNLKCDYCDTSHENGEIYSVEDLINEIKKYNLKTIHSISLTGGEPLLWSDFINELAQNVNLKLYLETNGTKVDELKKVINSIDFIASDIKLNSCAKQGDLFELHKKFLQVAKENNVETFLKIVFDENIEQEEIEKSIELAKYFDYEIFLQPKMNETNFECDLDFALKTFEKFKERYSKIKFCPQMHKFWGVR